jgi:signal transduction histidine kinase
LRSLSLKLVLAFLVVSLTGIAIIAFFTARSTSQAFGQFVLDQYQVDLIDQLGAYYQRNGSWDGVESTFPKTGPFKPNRQAAPFRDFRPIILASSTGELLFPDSSGRSDSQLSQSDLERSDPIEVDGEVVGFLLVQPGPFREDRPEAAFINQVYRVMTISATIAVTIALVLGILLARTLTRPLSEMTRATEAVAAGDLEQTVPVRSKDELGRLAASFNQMNARLKQARNSRRQLTADVAHELRTPVSVILAHVDGMQDGVLESSPDSIAVLQEEARRLNRIIDDLRLLTLAETRELQLERSTTEIAPLLELTAKAHRAEAQMQDVEIRLQIPTQLRAVYIDPDRILQVLSNLIANGLRFSPQGGELHISATDMKSGLVIGVQDDGPGIPPEDLPYVFDRFYKGDKSRHRGESAGSGLGLAIAKSIVEGHGGQIWAESQAGQGATVFFTLPATSPSLDKIQTRSS